MSIILAAFVFLDLNGNLNWQASLPERGTRRDNCALVANLKSAPREVREACGWFDLEETPPAIADGQQAVPTGYERTVGGYRQIYDVRRVEVPARRFYKYDISVAASENGEISNLVAFVSADVGVKWMWDAAEIIVETDPYFVAATNAVISSGVISDAKVRKILDRAYDLGQTVESSK